MAYPPLYPGDVLLLTPTWDEKRGQFSCSDQLICLLTKSPVSHAALYYRYDDARHQHRMLEQTIPQARESDFPAPKARSSIYVRRSTEKNFDGQKVIAKAKMYVDEKNPYSLVTLVLCGVLLITEPLPPDEKSREAWRTFVRTLIQVLIMICHGKNSTAMVCSQFVAQCYDEAGYPLPVRPYAPHAAAGAALPLSLAQLAARELEKPNAAAPAWPDLTAVPQDAESLPGSLEALEDLCCIILSMLKLLYKNQPAAQADISPLPQDCIDEAALFAYLVLHGVPADSPLPSLTAKEAANALIRLQAIRYTFVSPEDLRTCGKLQDAGIILPGNE